MSVTSGSVTPISTDLETGNYSCGITDIQDSISVAQKVLIYAKIFDKTSENTAFTLPSASCAGSETASGWSHDLYNMQHNTRKFLYLQN